VHVCVVCVCVCVVLRCVGWGGVMLCCAVLCGGGECVLRVCLCMHVRLLCVCVCCVVWLCCDVLCGVVWWGVRACACGCVCVCVCVRACVWCGVCGVVCVHVRVHLFEIDYNLPDGHSPLGTPVLLFGCLLVVGCWSLVVGC